jgi:hypothetical protein
MGPPLDKYHEIAFVAQGGMARVYRARTRAGGRVVAVREVSGGPGSAERIESERRGAEIQRALCHIDARVPKVFDIFMSDAGWLYVEMEYIEGEDLAAILQRGAMPVADAVRVARELFDFLRIAHGTAVSVDGEQRNQQVHGDLTPRNVRIDPNGGVRILDFGIAKGLKATLTAASFANYGYVSPERARTGRMGISDDFWCGGVVFYEMLSGQRAFPGTYEEISAALADRRGPAELDSRLPGALRLIVKKLLAWDPAYRYSDAAAVLSDLDAFQKSLPTRAEAEADASRTRVVPRPPPLPPDVARTTVLPGNDARRAPLQPATGLGMNPEHGRRVHGAPPGGGRTTAVPPLPPPRSRRLARTAAVVILFFAVAHEVSVWNDAKDRSAIAATESGDLEALWSDYEALRERALLRLTTSGLARVVANRLLLEATTALKDYRQDEPRIRERQVEQARAQLARAVRLRPNSDATEAWLRYAQGQLARIEGDAARGDLRRQAWARAVASFEAAARLAPELPDPYIGLTRIYTHREYRDPERARWAMSEAERRGHPRGIREHAQLGDLFKDEGDLLYRQARSVRGTASEDALLGRARAELVNALGEYEQSKGFGQTSARILEINDTIRRIDGRLAPLPDDETDTQPALEVEESPL